MDEENIETVDNSGSDVLDSVSDSSDSPAPVQVISVDELIERLTPSEEMETGETADNGETETEEQEPTAADEYFTYALQDTTNDEILTAVQAIRQDIESSVHPALTTQFSDYTVTEALLLLALVGGVASVCVKKLRRAFLWLN